MCTLEFVSLESGKVVIQQQSYLVKHDWQHWLISKFSVVGYSCSDDGAFGLLVPQRLEVGERVQNDDL